ncbi:MAG TPA: hypothetical protein VI547_03195, partial [Anaerolineales bacterium]|nr:hypothetical protein [Anaerolineales bacterium]
MGMNLGLILRDSWRITWRSWQLWLLTLLLFAVFIPAGVLSFSFSAVATAITFPIADPQLLFFIRRLQSVPGPAWVGVAFVAFMVLIATTAVALILQAATMRGAALAAEGGKASLGEMLRLGKSRVANIVKLSLTFGLIIVALGLLPSLALILLGDKSPLGARLINLAQTGLTPITTVLNFVLLLAIMSIALEDFTPRKAFGRAGSVFRVGWWAFIIVVGLSGVATLITGIILSIP